MIGFFPDEYDADTDCRNPLDTNCVRLDGEVNPLVWRIPHAENACPKMTQK